MTTPLTPEQLRTLDTLLADRETQLGAEIAAGREAIRLREEARGPEVTDPEEQADDQAAEGVADAEIERDLAELAGVQAARLRIGAGLYGQCIDCEEPIALQRLMAQPAATRCTRCQAGYEDRHALS
ncbi:MAG: TraR/DksA family transcriptional regulator [Rhizobacter sp.]|nr:TraR/DksA family transcriptional regulator [Rhizobacter sp.]